MNINEQVAAKLLNLGLTKAAKCITDEAWSKTATHSDVMNHLENKGYEHTADYLRANFDSEQPPHATASTGAIRSKLYEQGHRFPLRYDLMLDNDVAMRRIAETFGAGFLKYPLRNWKKGFPESVYVNHAFEHLRMYLTGDQTEDHLAHATWNLMALMFVQERLPELLDLDTKPWPPRE